MTGRNGRKMPRGLCPLRAIHARAASKDRMQALKGGRGAPGWFSAIKIVAIVIGVWLISGVRWTTIRPMKVLVLDSSTRRPIPKVLLIVGHRWKGGIIPALNAAFSFGGATAATELISYEKVDGFTGSDGTFLSRKTVKFHSIWSRDWESEPTVIDAVHPVYLPAGCPKRANIMGTGRDSLVEMEVELSGISLYVKNQVQVRGRPRSGPRCPGKMIPFTVNRDGMVRKLEEIVDQYYGPTDSAARKDKFSDFRRFAREWGEVGGLIGINLSVEIAQYKRRLEP